MDLGSKVKTALRWVSSVMLIGQLLMWVATIFVIRQLAPADYGLMAIAMLVIAFLMVINELGMGAVLVQKENLDDLTIRKIFGLTLIVNVSFYVILFLSAPLIASFFGESEIVLLIRVLAIQFILSAFEIIPVAKLERELDFKKKSIIYAISNVLGVMVSLAMAYMGYGVWALVWGNILAAFLKTAGVNVVSKRFFWPVFSLKGMKEVLSFGGLITLERGMWYFYSQADIFIIAKILGKEVLGIYSVAMNLATMIMHKTGGIVYEVSFPAFSRAQKESPEMVSKYFLKASRIMSFISFPLFIGMSSVADNIVLVILGEKWIQAGFILMLLCLIVPFRMLSNLLPPALQGVGEPAMSVKNLLVATIVMPVSIYIGTYWGLIGVCIAWVVAFPVVFMITVHNASKVIGFSMRDFISETYLPVVMSAIMYLVVTASAEYYFVDTSSIVNFVVLIFIGMLAYASLAMVFCKKLLGEVFSIVRGGG